MKIRNGFVTNSSSSSFLISSKPHSRENSLLEQLIDRMFLDERALLGYRASINELDEYGIENYLACDSEMWRYQEDGEDFCDLPLSRKMEIDPSFKEKYGKLVGVLKQDGRICELKIDSNENEVISILEQVNEMGLLTILRRIDG